MRHKRRFAPSIPKTTTPSSPPEAFAPINDGSSYNCSSCIFDVLMFGAVGDAISNDREAFKTVWDNACEVESGVLLVPYGYSFMIQSTTFTGPCEICFLFPVILISSLHDCSVECFLGRT